MDSDQCSPNDDTKYLRTYNNYWDRNSYYSRPCKKSKRYTSSISFANECGQNESRFDTVKQILTLQEMIKAAIANQAEDVVLIGLVNRHVLECANPDCSCKNEAILYDAATQKFSQRNGKILIFE